MLPHKVSSVLVVPVWLHHLGATYFACPAHDICMQERLAGSVMPQHMCTVTRHRGHSHGVVTFACKLAAACNAAL